MTAETTLLGRQEPVALEQVSFPVIGMSCASCVRRIEKTLGRLEGVEQATVNLATGRAAVEFDRQRVDLAQLVQAVEKAGYGVGELSTSTADAALDAVQA